MKNNCRLVHVTASLNRGGAETVLYHLVSGLRPNFEQTVISMREGVMAHEIRALGVPVYCLGGTRFFGIIRLWRLLNELKPEVIHALLWSTSVLMKIYCKITGVPVVCAVHSPFNGNAGNVLWRSAVDRMTGSWATKTVFVTAATREYAVRNGQVLSAQSVIIENGIDADFLGAAAKKQAVSRATLGFDDQHVIMGTVGRLVPVKNHRLLLLIMAQLKNELPQLRLIIVGGGPLKNQLGEEIKALGIGDVVRLVTGLGTAYYPLFDFFVLPSHAEGLSIALLEAMSFGLPVMVSPPATGGVVSQSENGLICGSEALAQWVAGVHDLVVDKRIRAVLGKRAAQTVNKRFDSKIMVESYKKLFGNPQG